MLNEEEEERNIINDVGEDAIFNRLAYMTEVKQGENALINGSDDELI
jgi:hypothetical protein